MLNLGFLWPGKENVNNKVQSGIQTLPISGSLNLRLYVGLHASSCHLNPSLGKQIPISTSQQQGTHSTAFRGGKWRRGAKYNIVMCCSYSCEPDSEPTSVHEKIFGWITLVPSGRTVFILLPYYHCVSLFAGK